MRGMIARVGLMLATDAIAQRPAPDIPAQKAAIAGLAAFDGLWRGTATIYERDKPPLHLIHTERVGPMLDSSVRVIEGKSYDADGKDGGFNALAIVSCSAPGTCEMRSHAQGYAGTFPIVVRNGGFEWRREVGPGMQLFYTATVTGAEWSEEGWVERGGQKLAKIFEMKVRRVGPTDWPAAGALGPK